MIQTATITVELLPGVPVPLGLRHVSPGSVRAALLVRGAPPLVEGQDFTVDYATGEVEVAADLGAYSVRLDFAYDADRQDPAVEAALETDHQALRSQRMSTFEGVPPVNRTAGQRQAAVDDHNTVLLALARWIRRREFGEGS